MRTTIFWFRNDLRLHDQVALQVALADQPQALLPVVCVPDFTEVSTWGFPRISAQRRYWSLSAILDLSEQLANLGCPLLICPIPAVSALPQLANCIGTRDIVCEEIAAPEERAQINALQNAGMQVRSVWQSSLLDPQTLPWSTQDLPEVFTKFRQIIERDAIAPPAPLAAPTRLPIRPSISIPTHLQTSIDALTVSKPAMDMRSSFPLGHAKIDGGERAALRHLHHYLKAHLPHTYKQTRNQLMGFDFSSKWSPWLAHGALSVRQIYAELKQFEAQHGANDGSYWLWFELLWRDYFRFLHLQHGDKLYRARGLHNLHNGANASHDIALPDHSRHQAKELQRWCNSQTGEGLIDAAMLELTSTSYLSNRLRQVLASYFIYQMRGDWRAGAAWFEAQLIDFDVYSNQGNWLYIAGRGTDPRGGRIFNVQKQTYDHDKDGTYRRLWGKA